MVSKTLVIGPLRVARDTWPAEVEKWEHLADLDVSVIVGDVKARTAALNHNALVYIINRENVKWLVEYYEKNGLRWDFDCVVIDELSSFKNHQAQRFKWLRKVRPFVKRWIGLTGTPTSNGLMDLWAEIGILDGGERLGRFIGRFRECYFKAGSMNPATGVVFSYVPRPDAEEQIYQRISDITISMKAMDYLQMPECIFVNHEVEMSATERKLYDQLKSDLIIPLENGDIDAANAASLSNKLLQMANGAVYDENKEVRVIHQHKLEALKGRDCYGGLDLSSTGDITAFVLVFPPRTEDEKYIVLPFFWIPEDTIPLRVRRASVPYDVWHQQGYLMATEGNVIHYGFIEKFIEELGKQYHILEIAFDRWGATQMVQDLEGMGFTVVPFGQGFKDMSPPTKEFYKLLMEGKIIHGGNPVLRWMAGNVVVDRDPAENIKPTKAKSPEKIDGIVATIMALDRCIRNQGQQGSVYDERPLIVF